MPGVAAYSATKAAQIAFTESLRAELWGSGVHACVVVPIGTDTEFDQVATRASGGKPWSSVGPQQPAAAVARAIVRCIRRPRPEVYPHAASRLVVWLNAVAPGLQDRIWARAARRAGRL
jgi:short-subunit dehydrogenase